MRLNEACTLIVAGLGRPTATDVYEFLASDGWPTSRASVKSTLYDLLGATVELAVQGDGQHGGQKPNRYRLTEAGRAWLVGETGESRCAA